MLSYKYTDEYMKRITATDSTSIQSIGWILMALWTSMNPSVALC